jgi:hypothetical protein
VILILVVILIVLPLAVTKIGRAMMGLME